MQWSFDGGTWTDYTETDQPIFTDVSQALKVQLQVYDDSFADNGETFTLEATYYDYPAIYDSGLGTIYDDDATNGDPSSGSLIIDSIVINEKSTYGVHTLENTTAASLTITDLNVSDGDGAGGLSTTGIGGTTVEYYDGAGWVIFDGTPVTIDANAKLFVRISIVPEQDSELDTSEKYRLFAEQDTGEIVAGLGTIMDDGTGGRLSGDNYRWYTRHEH